MKVSRFFQFSARGGAGRHAEGVLGCECPPPPPLAGQIISKSCSFLAETEFTPLILASKSDLFKNRVSMMAIEVMLCDDT